MKFTAYTGLICCVVAAFLGGRHMVEAGGPENHVKIRSSVESTYGSVKADGIIDAAPDAVWRVLTDYVHFSEYMPGVKNCEIVGRDGNKVRLQYRIGISIFTSSYTVELEEGKESRWQSWRAVAGDFDINSGSWRLFPLDRDRTRLFYDVKLSHKLFPDFIIIRLLTGRLPGIYEAIGRQAKNFR